MADYSGHEHEGLDYGYDKEPTIDEADRMRQRQELEDKAKEYNLYTPPAEEETYDPLSPEVAPGVQVIIQMRIYDVLMAIYTDMNPTGADALIQLHSQGKILGPLPTIDM